MDSNPIFAPGPDWTLNACLNWGMDPWHAYSEGYRRAAEVLTEYVRTRHQDQDILIYPVLYSWRHHIELKLKAIARSASAFLNRPWTPPRDHDVGQLFGTARALAEECYAEFSEKLPAGGLAEVRKAVANLRSIDAASMTFRYPEDLDGGKHLEGPHHINFAVVEAHMTGIADTLDGVESALELFHEWQSDAFSSY